MLKGMKFLTTAAMIALSGVVVACGGGGTGHSSVYYAYSSVYSDVCDSYDPYSSCYYGSDYYDYSSYYDGYYDGYSDGSSSSYSDGYYDGYSDGYYDPYYDYYYGSPTLNAGDASDATDTNFAAINSEANKAVVAKAAKKLVKDYGFTDKKATAIASALNVWSVARVERGFSSPRDVEVTFKKVFGVSQSDALAAVKSYTTGDKAPLQDVTNRSASALGLKPHQAQKFIKGMYKKALADWGYDANSISW